MGVAGALFLALSFATGEAHALPTNATTWTALLYLIVIGSFAAFLLFLVVLQRWAASAASFQWVMLPLVAVPLSAVLTGESVTTALLVGGVLVLLGVYIGAIWRPRSTGGAEHEATPAAGARK
jgi:drug/metabolite transporter (DMT)-like permease